MLAAPRSAIDRPLKLLVWEDGQGKVWISHNSEQFLQMRHSLPQELMAHIAGGRRVGNDSGRVIPTKPPTTVGCRERSGATH